MTIETVNLPELNWPPGTLARVWFCQPALSLSAQPPYIPVAPASTLALFEAVLALDAALGQPEAGAPSIIIMPELALAPTDVLRVLELMATARANTLLVAGVGQMTQAQVDTIEPDRATLFDVFRRISMPIARLSCVGAAGHISSPRSCHQLTSATPVARTRQRISSERARLGQCPRREGRFELVVARLDRACSRAAETAMSAQAEAIQKCYSALYPHGHLNEVARRVPVLSE